MTVTTSQQTPPHTAIHRTAAIGLLDLAFHQRITMVVAPAGSGKTELLRQWATGHGPKRVAWITVTADRDLPGRLLAELRRARTGAPRDREIAIVLDDFHRLDDDDLATDIAGVLATLPERVHVVVASRSDPPMAFYRLDPSGLQVELRQDALALDDREAAMLLGTADLEDERIRRAEGWLTGLLLDDGGLARYFDDEVLDGLDAEILDFLVQTSVLPEPSGPLCDVVTGRPGSDAMLARLRKASLFVVRPPGSPRHRYHGQFRAHLRRRLHDTDPALEARLLVRAATWHLDHDEFDAGMSALVEAEAWDDVFVAAFAHAPRLLAVGRASAVARWLAKVPDTVRRGRPDALLLEAAARLFGNEPTRATEALDAFDGLDELAVALEERTVADLLRGYLALQRGAVWQAVAASDRVNRAVDRREAFDGPNVFGLTGCLADVAAAAGVLRGVGLVYEGRLHEARTSLDPAFLGSHAVWQVSALGALALVEASSGRLGRAEQLAAQALAIAEELSLHADLVTTSAFLALATVARERDDLDRARAFLDEAARRTGPGQSRLVASAVAVEDALLAAALGDPAHGLGVLAARGDLDHPSMPPAVVVRRRAVQAQLLLLLGDAEAAEDVLAAAPPGPVGTELAGARMRLAVERHDLDAARRIGERWPDDGVVCDRVERHLWRGIVAHLDGDERTAREELAAAVADAEPERALGPFRRAGAHVLGPARALYRMTPTPFVRSIVEQPTAPVIIRVSTKLVEQLTHREYLVLSLLPTRLSNSEIAEQLEVSLNTVKTHLKHIYRKLDVPGRREAVGSAEQLRLL